MKEKLILKQFQEEGKEYLVRQHNSYLADDMGLGKTIQVIAAINELKAKKILIVCPTTVKYNWKKEIERFGYREFRFQIINKTKHIFDYGANITIISYDLVKYHYKTIMSQKWAMLVCDEAQKVKNPEALRTQLTLGPEGIYTKAIYRILLSGTPIENHPIDIFMAIKALRPDLLGKFMSYRQFGIQYCSAYWEGYSMRYGKPSGKKAEEIKEILSRFMLRRVKEEVLKQLPPVTYQMIPIQLDAKISGIIREEATRRAKKALGRDQENGTWQKLALAKINQCVDHIKTVLESEQKVVVYTYHKEVLAQLMERLYVFNPIKIDGSQSAKQKQDTVDAFVEDPSRRVLVGQIEAAGVGTDGLQKVCRIAIFVQISYAPGDMKQAVDRLNRMGQKNAVIIQFLLIEKSFEMRMFEMNLDKIKTIKKIIKAKGE